VATSRLASVISSPGVITGHRRRGCVGSRVLPRRFDGWVLH
jgi:hypothetical protein